MDHAMMIVGQARDARDHQRHAGKREWNRKERHKQAQAPRASGASELMKIIKWMPTDVNDTLRNSPFAEYRSREGKREELPTFARIV
jgi:hypothetical protein